MLEETPDQRESWTVKFGKYRGQTYKSIVMLDPGYARWLVTVLQSESAKDYVNLLLNNQ